MISLTAPKRNSRPKPAEKTVELQPVYWLQSGIDDAPDYRVVAMFTVGSAYEAESGRLLSSLIDHGIPFHIEAIVKAPSWDHAVAQKPFLIKRAMAMYPNTPLLIVDVDAWFHVRPEVTEEIQAADFAAHWFQGPSGGYENRNDNRMLSGTMWWNDTHKSKELLAAWIRENQRVFHGGGQANLETCLGNIPGLNVHKLPGRWCRVFDKPQFYPKNEPTWIEHTIASRENRGSSFGRKDPARRIRIEELEPQWKPRTVVLPNRGEFGLKICFHATAVHALGTPDLVIHEPGEEILYPRAQRTIEISPAKDDARRGMQERDPVVANSVENVFRTAYPKSRQVVTDDKLHRSKFTPLLQSKKQYDVVICPRLRNYGGGKNWPYWNSITDQLGELGLNLFGAGKKNTSMPVDCDGAWEYSNPLEASMMAMQSSKVVLCTDSGLAHLAAMCGAKILMIVDGDDLVAPGYWPVKIDRFEGADLTMICDGWSNPDKVIAEVMAHV
jgi:hypothetical protein